MYLAASDVSREGQQSYKRWIRINLALVVFAALLGTAGGWLADPAEKVFAVAIAVTFIGAMMTKFINQQLRGDSDWFDGRAVAESVKTNSWRYMMRVPPFRHDSTSDTYFAARMRAILNEYKGISHNLTKLPEEMHQISTRMRGMRDLEWEDRRVVYLRTRLDPQVRWYRSRADDSLSASRRWIWASFGAELAGLVIALAIIAAPSGNMINLVGVVASMAAGFQAWTQVCRHAELSRSYGLACQELLAITDLMNNAPEEKEFVKAVEYSEEAISREHTMWVAKRT